ncbi:MAG: dUTP diphosphatase [Pseudomonadota bacterium]
MTKAANIDLPVRSLPHLAGLPLPTYQTTGAAGMDLVAAVPENEPIVLEPGGRALIPTGLSIAVPDGFEAQIRPRSGLALKDGITCLNTPGTIDSDYRGEVGILLINHGADAFAVTRGMRIAQMIVAPVTRAELVEVAALPETVRADGGFGSTGRQTHSIQQTSTTQSDSADCGPKT